jgi:hypothetical protein
MQNEYLAELIEWSVATAMLPVTCITTILLVLTVLIPASLLELALCYPFGYTTVLTNGLITLAWPVCTGLALSIPVFAIIGWFLGLRHVCIRDL